MTRKAIANASISLSTDDQINNVFKVTSERIMNPYQVLHEYVKNSVDSALRLKGNKTKFPYPIKITIDYLNDSNEIIVLDNAEGMDVEDIQRITRDALITKDHKIQVGLYGGVGYGFQSFRGYYKKLKIITRKKGGRTLEICLKRGKENISDIPIYESEEDFPYESGTKIELLDYDPIPTKKKISAKGIKKMILTHYNNVLELPNISLSILEDSENEQICDLDEPVFHFEHKMTLSKII
jgi:DNA topoisomerase VI subunit B